MTKLKKIPWVGIIALLSTIITGSWVADGLKGEALFSEWFPLLGEYKYKPLVTTVSLIFFIISFLWLYRYRGAFLAVRTLKQLHTCEPHTCLILLLSTPDALPSSFSFPMEITDRNNNKATLKGKSLEEDIDILNKIRWNWQQFLRGIEPHRSESKLKYVYLVGSEDSGKFKGSFNFLDHAEALLKQYCRDATVFRPEKPVSFENLDELVRIINKAIKKFERFGVGEEDIIIDVTGGQKTTSIAGAVVTLNSQVTFQYVQTNEPYNVLAYDVVIQSPVSP